MLSWAREALQTFSWTGRGREAKRSCARSWSLPSHRLLVPCRCFCVREPARQREKAQHIRGHLVFRTTHTLHDAQTRQGPVAKGWGGAHRPALSGLAGGEDSSARRRLAPTRRFWFVNWAPWPAPSVTPIPGASACVRASISCSLPHTRVAHLRGRRTCQQTRMLCLSCVIDRARGAAVQFSKA